MMNQTKKRRKDIYANGSEVGWQETEEQLRAHVYADSEQWRRGLNLLLPALGLSLLVSGILFFFAYNWDELPAFVKLGGIEGVLIIALGLVLFGKWSLPTKQIVLTGAAFLVGALFAVYGQIYQTGADAYDFFLVWTVFVTLWAIAAGYPPLWLLWIGLVNVTIYLYITQMISRADELYYLLQSASTLFCAGCVVVAEAVYATKKSEQRAAWFINIVALAAIGGATWNVSSNILSNFHGFALSGPVALLVLAAGLWYGYRKRVLFYIATIPFCGLLIFEALLLQVLNLKFNAGILLLLGLIFVAGTTALVSLIIKLKKQWYGTTTAQ